MGVLGQIRTCWKRCKYLAEWEPLGRKTLVYLRKPIKQNDRKMELVKEINIKMQQARQFHKFQHDLWWSPGSRVVNLQIAFPFGVFGTYNHQCVLHFVVWSRKRRQQTISDYSLHLLYWRDSIKNSVTLITIYTLSNNQIECFTCSFICNNLQ